MGGHRELVRTESRYRAVVTRETEEETASAAALLAGDGGLHTDEVPDGLEELQELEEIEETA